MYKFLQTNHFYSDNIYFDFRKRRLKVNRHLHNYLRYYIFDLTIFILFKNWRWKEWRNELEKPFYAMASKIVSLIIKLYYHKLYQEPHNSEF